MSTVAVTTPMSPMAMLRSGIPLSLLLDLMLGPCSEDLIIEERRALRRQQTQGA